MANQDRWQKPNINSYISSEGIKGYVGDELMSRHCNTYMSCGDRGKGKSTWFAAAKRRF